MFLNFSDIANNNLKEFDVCIVGSGPAGLSVARELNNTNINVIVLESGSMEPDARYSELNKGISSGPRDLDTQNSRIRCFGGASKIWAGVCRPFSEDDFSEKSFVPLSGWPISFKDIEPYYKDASKLLGFKYEDFKNRKWHASYKTGLAFSEFKRKDSLLSPMIFQKASVKKRDFSIQFKELFEKSKNIKILFNATVVKSILNYEKNSISELQILDINANNSFKIKAKKIVFAAGALENPRLLMLNKDISDRLNFTGKCFMSHPGFPNASKLIHSKYGECLSTPQIESSKSHLLFETNIKTRFKQSMLRHSIVPVESSVKRQLSAYKNNINDFSDLFNIVDVIKNVGFWSALKSATCYITSEEPRIKVWNLSIGIEQSPNINSFVSLSSDKDQLGVEKLNIHWNSLNDIEKHTIKNATNIFSREVGITDLGKTKLSEDLLSEKLYSREDPINHHIGTTRMSTSSATGVVDKNCKVFNVNNLYIAGSSVFTTSSMVNPTFTIIALSLRLGKYLKKSLLMKQNL